MMHRTFISLAASDVRGTRDTELYGQLSGKLSFAVEPAQRAAWNYQIDHLRDLAQHFPSAYFAMEFLIPRMGRRADLIILLSGLVFVIEYKVGSGSFDRSSLNQTYDYGLDLKHFHEPSHDRRIIPILVVTKAAGGQVADVDWDEDGLARPVSVNADEVAPR